MQHRKKSFMEKTESHSPGENLSFNTIVSTFSRGATIEIDRPLKLTADLDLPENISLVFGPHGQLNGAFTLIGNNTKILADPEAWIFGLEVKIIGVWQAEFTPSWFGAIYDGTTDCTAAIQKCLDQRGEIRLRGTGTALISKSLWIYGGTRLLLDPGFTIRLADQSCCPMLRTQWADQRYFAQSFPDFVHNPAFPHFISATDSPDQWQLGKPEENIIISGGTWDANGANNPGLSYLWGTFGFFGCLMQIVHVHGFILKDTTLYDATMYSFEGAKLTGFHIENIHIDMRELRPNTDGIHLEGECYNGVISNIHGRTWDDMVALNGGDSWYPKYPPGIPAPERGTGMNVRWIPLLQGGIKHVIIQNIHVTEGMLGYRAVRLLAADSHKMDEILIDGIYGKFAINAVFISSHYEKTAPYGTIIIRNLNCEVYEKEELSETKDFTRHGHIKLEARTTVDTLMLDNIRYIRNTGNGQFFQCLGKLSRLFVCNMDLSVGLNVCFFGRGAFNCIGDSALVEEAFFTNFSLNRQANMRYDIAFQGNFRRISLTNCTIEADTVFALNEPEQSTINCANTTFLCKKTGMTEDR